MTGGDDEFNKVIHNDVDSDSPRECDKNVSNDERAIHKQQKLSTQNVDNYEDHDPCGYDYAFWALEGISHHLQPYTPRVRYRRKNVAIRYSSAHPDSRDPQTLKKAWENLVDKRSWNTIIQVRSIFSQWEDIVGQAVACHTRPVSFDEGKLIVTADQTVWATQLRTMSSIIIATINDMIGEKLVTTLEIQGPSFSWKRGKRSIRNARGPRDTYG